MSAPICPRHQIEMEIAPAEPRSRCRACGFLTHHLRFDHCPECGQRLLIEEPASHWHCPMCAPAVKVEAPGAYVGRESRYGGEDAWLASAAPEREIGQ
jgi:hypothetical protein